MRTIGFLGSLSAAAMMSMLLAAPAGAATVSYVVKGVFHSAETHDQGRFPIDIAAGDAYTLVVSYNTATPDTDGSDPVRGSYTGAITSATLNVNGQILALPVGEDHAGINISLDDWFGASNDSYQAGVSDLQGGMSGSPLSQDQVSFGWSILRRNGFLSSDALITPSLPSGDSLVTAHFGIYTSRFLLSPFDLRENNYSASITSIARCRSRRLRVTTLRARRARPCPKGRRRAAAGLDREPAISWLASGVTRIVWLAGSAIRVRETPAGRAKCRRV